MLLFLSLLSSCYDGIGGRVVVRIGVGKGDACSEKGEERTRGRDSLRVGGLR